MPDGFDLAAIVFALSLVATFALAWIGRRASRRAPHGRAGPSPPLGAGPASGPATPTLH